MYNNLTQQTPYIPYSYGINPQYQRVVQQELQNPIPSQPTAMPMMPNYIKGRPVVSIDEARASQIDLDGSLYVFPDLGNKKIYTKQINMDGTATFNVFTLAPEVASAEEPAMQMYVTKEELNKILEDFRATLPAPAPAPVVESKPKPAPVFNL